MALVPILKTLPSTSRVLKVLKPQTKVLISMQRAIESSMIVINFQTTKDNQIANASARQEIVLATTDSINLEQHRARELMEHVQEGDSKMPLLLIKLKINSSLTTRTSRSTIRILMTWWITLCSLRAKVKVRKTRRRPRKESLMKSTMKRVRPQWLIHLSQIIWTSSIRRTSPPTQLKRQAQRHLHRNPVNPWLRLKRKLRHLQPKHSRVSLQLLHLSQLHKSPQWRRDQLRASWMLTVVVKGLPKAWLVREMMPSSELRQQLQSTLRKCMRQIV